MKLKKFLLSMTALMSVVVLAACSSKTKELAGELVDQIADDIKEEIGAVGESIEGVAEGIEDEVKALFSEGEVENGLGILPGTFAANYSEIEKGENYYYYLIIKPDNTGFAHMVLFDYNHIEEYGPVELEGFAGPITWDNNNIYLEMEGEKTPISYSVYRHPYDGGEYSLLLYIDKSGMPIRFQSTYNLPEEAVNEMSPEVKAMYEETLGY